MTRCLLAAGLLAAIAVTLVAAAARSVSLSPAAAAAVIKEIESRTSSGATWT
jgi:hypothetical protein